MRIVVSSSPKAGNHWIKCLLGKVYDLEWIGGGEKPDIQPRAFREWVEQGGFPDQAIFHQHARFTRKLCDVIDAVPAHLVTIVRDPYDVFVSLYYWNQERAVQGLGKKKVRPRHSLDGKPLDHPDVLAYLADEFGSNMSRANDWLHSGRSLVVRYEGLHRDPLAELKRVTDRIAPVPTERLEAAIDECRAENMRQMSEKMGWHVRSAKVGDSRERLGEAHLAVFRERYADLIRSLGYEVR
jgi:hypothetical protein